MLSSNVEHLKHDQDVLTGEGAAFELVDILVANSVNTVHMLCESITLRITGASERVKKQAINPSL